MDIFNKNTTKINKMEIKSEFDNYCQKQITTMRRHALTPRIIDDFEDDSFFETIEDYGIKFAYYK
jgi:hypothetical protein